MKKMLIAVLIAGSPAMWGPARADSNCKVGSGPVAAGAYEGGVQACLNSPYAAGGTVTATPNYVVVDGRSTNSEPLDGYVGYSYADGGLVACASGEYSPAGGNNSVGTSLLDGPCRPQPI